MHFGMSAENVASEIALLVRLIERRPDLIMEDALGPFRYQVYF